MTTAAPRLLLLTQDFPPKFGGMARYYDELFRALPRGTGAVVSARAEAHGGGGPGDFPFPVHRLSRPPRGLRTWLDWRVATREIDAVVRKSRPDLLVAGNFRPFGELARRVGGRHGVPYVVVFHGLDLMRLEVRGASSRWRRRLFERIARGAGGFVFNTSFTAGLMEEHFPHWLDGRPWGVVRPGVDVERFRPGEAPPGDGPPVLLTVARYAARKGIDTVIRAMPGILRRRPDVIYRVRGKGNREPYLRLAEEVGVAHAVDLGGPVSEEALPALYRECTLFVMLAREEDDGVDVEGFGIVYLEAGASGRAVVGADSGGVAEAVVDGETGLLVPPADPEAGAAAILGLLDDPERARRLGVAGRARAETSFTWSRQARGLLELAETVVGRGAG